MVLSGLSINSHGRQGHLLAQFGAFHLTPFILTPFVRPLSVDVPIPLSYQSLVVIRRVDLINDGWIIDGDAHDVPLMLMQNGPCPLPCGGRALEQLFEEPRPPNDGVPAALGQCRHHDGALGQPVSFEDSLDSGDANVRQVDGPDENRRGPDRLKSTESTAQRCNWARFGLRILHNHAVVARENRLNAGGVWPQYDHSRFDLEGFERFKDANRERKSQEVQQGFGRTHPGRPAGRQHDAR